MTIDKIVIYLNAIVFLLYGVAFAAFPEWLSQLVTGAVPGSIPAMIDARASIGGLSVGVGVLLFATAADSAYTHLGLLGVFVIALCMASGRLLGIILDGEPNSVMILYFILELSMAVFAAWLLGRDRAVST